MAETSPRSHASLGGVYPITTGETVYLVTISNRFGVENYVFSTQERADAWAFNWARAQWQERSPETFRTSDTDCPEFWIDFQEQFPDDCVETDSPTIDNEG